jgi:adenylate cyclase
VGIGVHTGTAFFGTVGSSEGVIDITALGDAVNTAARLASTAGTGEIIVSDAAYQAAGIHRDGLERRQLELKGKSESTPVHVIRVGAGI